MAAASDSGARNFHKHRGFILISVTSGQAGAERAANRPGEIETNGGEGEREREGNAEKERVSPVGAGKIIVSA